MGPVTRRLATALLLGLLLPIAPNAQEGFPLDGTWRGQWGTEDNPTSVVIVMKWDGSSIGGQINPGPDSVEFESAVLEPSDWTVRIQAAPPGSDPVTIVGKLEDIGSYNRMITGTWEQSGTSHPFQIRRE